MEWNNYYEILYIILPDIRFKIKYWLQLLYIMYFEVFTKPNKNLHKYNLMSLYKM